MTRNTPDILPSIRTLPLPQEAQRLFSGAVRIVQQRPGEFASVASWLRRHYSQDAMQKRCEQEHRARFRLRLMELRECSPAYRRRRDERAGCPPEDLMRDRVEEARLRGHRLEGLFLGPDDPRRAGMVVSSRSPLVCFQVVTRPIPPGPPIDRDNVHVAMQCDDQRYLHDLRTLRAERPGAKLDEHDHLPECPERRLRQAVDDLIDAEYPDGEAHVEHSRRIVAVAALLMPESLPVLGAFGAWPFESQWPTDQQACCAEQGPHRYQPALLDLRKVGREEVLFVRIPGEARKARFDFPLDDLLSLLRVAVDELDALPQQQGRAEPQAMPANAALQTPDGHFSPAQLADIYHLDPEATRQALNRWRRKHAGGDGYIENPDRRPNEPQYLYSVKAVESVLENLQRLVARRDIRRTKTSGLRPAQARRRS